MADSIKNYDPTPREAAYDYLYKKLRSLGADHKFADTNARSISDPAGMGLLDLIPGVSSYLAATEGGKQAGQGAAKVADGEVGNGLLDMAMGTVPTALAGLPFIGRPAALGAREALQEATKAVGKRDVTVKNAQRIAYPGIYARPDLQAAEAASRVAPENPLLQRLFGVTRDDLWQIGQQGMRDGNNTGLPFKTAANPRGAEHVADIITPRNTQRVQDLIGESMNYPRLHEPMASWYVMDPLYDQFKRLHGTDGAKDAYNQFNTLTGMASPGSEVLTELNRGTTANWLKTQGRWPDFMEHAGKAEFRRGADFPDDMRAVIGHPYHKTAQAGAMDKYVGSGMVDMGSAKVPSYIGASGVPDTGFQSNWMVSDAHHSRIIGLPDVRGAATKKGKEVLPNASASVPEVVSMQPWWEHQIARPTGLSSVGAQGVVWGAGSGATGVTSPIGAPKLELLAQQIGKAAVRMGVTPEQARDMILTGRAHAGVVTPELAAAMAAAGGAGALGVSSLLDD